MSEVANIPQLRFPGFSDEWEERPLKDVSTFFNGKAYKQAELLSSGKYPVLRVGNFFTNNSWYYSNLELDENKYCDNGDLLYAWSASFGPRIWAGEKVIYHYHIWKVINHSQVTKKFLFIVLDNETAKMKAQSANGFALLHITKGTIENWKINLPTRQEQQKIAAFLAAVDSKIEQLSKKQALLGEYKKGLMQQIFSQAIRFKANDDSEFPDWEEKKLGDVCKLQGGYAFKSAEFQKHGIPIIRISNISNNNDFIDNRNLVYYNEIKNSDKFIIKNGDLIVAMSGATTGKSSIYNLIEDAYLNQRVGLFKANNSLLDYGFLIQIVFSYIFATQLDSVLVAGAQPNVSSKDIEGFEISLPSKIEQNKIANFLSSIDRKIEQVSKQLVESKQFKKALLQQMFV